MRKKERDGGRPRERISGKIIAKFEYDSPHGYDPVEDIPEILQASFVQGLLSLSAVFFGLLPKPPALFPPSLAVVLSRAVSVSIHPSSCRFSSPREGRTNLRAFHAIAVSLYEGI